jgi:hypothetical protein
MEKKNLQKLYWHAVTLCERLDREICKTARATKYSRKYKIELAVHLLVLMNERGAARLIANHFKSEFEKIANGATL